MLKAVIEQIVKNNFCQPEQNPVEKEKKKSNCKKLRAKAQTQIEQDVGDNLCVCVMNILSKVSSYKPDENGDVDFSNCHVTSCWSLDQKVMFGSC